ncbi:MAG: HNH endonuclease [Gaiellaceae bacterium]
MKTHVALAVTLACLGVAGAAASTGAPHAGALDVGKTVLLAPRTKSSGCHLGSNPDRRCSPGAYYSKLVGRVICAPGFRTGDIRNVPVAEKFAVEREYGLAPGRYGRALEIDHIVPLELGGSNVIANLFPEKADAHPGYRAKDRLENALHGIVCRGAMRLRTAQRRIAANWQRLYAQVFGLPPPR